MASGTNSVHQLDEQLNAAQSKKELWQCCLHHFSQYNIVRVSYHHEPPSSASDFRDAHVVSEGYPDEWVQYYNKNHIEDIDPIVNFSRTRTKPFLFSKIQKVAKLTPAQHSYLAQMSNANLSDVVAVPVFGPNGRNGCVELGFQRSVEVVDHDTLREIQWACQLAHLRHCELVEESLAADQPELSPREKEVLQWVARGKSNTTIADIVGISTNTVDTHLRRIYSKLNVSDRTTAAIRGIGAGLIQ